MTRESFLEWRKKFEEEMNLKLGNSDTLSSQPSTRLTGIVNYTLELLLRCDNTILLLVMHIGRQMFERDASLALSDARFLSEGILYIPLINVMIINFSTYRIVISF